MVIREKGRSFVVDRQCDCAERTGELVVFTCPLCVTKAMQAMADLTTRGISVRLDRSGSVSGTLELEETLG